MLKTNLLCYMKRRRLRILIVAVIILLIAMFSMQNVYNFMRMSNLLSEVAIFTVADYMMGIFNSAQLVMYFIIPVSFSILIADLMRSDFDEGITQFILIRKHNRSDYLIEKCKMIIALAILYTFMMIIISFIVAVIFEVSFGGVNYHYLFLAFDNNVLKAFVTVISTFILGLSFIGIMTMTFSIHTNSAGIAVGIIILMGFAHNIFFVIKHDIALAWLPFSQYIVGHYNVFAPFGLNVPYFNGVFANLYMIVGSAILLSVIMQKLRKLEI